MAPPTAVVDVRHLVKRYGEKLVLDGFELTIERGETVVLIGGSGCGKSTFARLLVGLERPDEGEIWIDGVDLVGLGERALNRFRRKFAFVFQNHALLDSMSVFDNVAFPLREMGVHHAEIVRRVHHALLALEVDEAASKLPGQLSGGMAARVGLARAVVTEPEILVYDEPTTGLDPLVARVVDGLINRMRELYAVTSLVITHDMLTAYDVADRVVLVEKGKAVALPPREVLFHAKGEAAQPFVRESGIDFASAPPRTKHGSVAETCARWKAVHPPTAR